MRRRVMMEALVEGVNAAIAPHTPDAVLKPWGASKAIEVPGFRYTARTPPLGESTETMTGTVSGWVRGATLAETVIEAITKELHGDRWRTYRDLYWRVQFAGVRVSADDDPGVYRLDLDYRLETVRDVAYR